MIIRVDGDNFDEAAAAATDAAVCAAVASFIHIIIIIIIIIYLSKITAATEYIFHASSVQKPNMRSKT